MLCNGDGAEVSGVQWRKTLECDGFACSFQVSFFCVRFAWYGVLCNGAGGEVNGRSIACKCLCVGSVRTVYLSTKAQYGTVFLNYTPVAVSSCTYVKPCTYFVYIHTAPGQGQPYALVSP